MIATPPACERGRRPRDSRLGHFQVATDFAGCEIVDLTVARDAGGLGIGRIPPDRVLSSFAQEFAALLPQVPFEVAPPHTVRGIFSRITSGDSFRRAMSRFASKTMRRASLRFSRASSRVAPCVLTPGISSTYAAHHFPDFFMTAVSIAAKYMPRRAMQD